MKLSDRIGFVLAEILLAITLFVLAASILNQSFLNGLICQKKLAKKINKFDEFIAEIIKTTPNVSDLENITAIPLPNGQVLNIVFDIRQTKNKFLYKIISQSDSERNCFYIANTNWKIP